MDNTINQFRQQIQMASATRQPLRIRGGGSKDWYAQELRGELLDTRAHRGIMVYEPTELVMRVKCGTPLAEVQQELAGNQQMLAFEPPSFGADATIGGVVSAGLSGPRRPYAGALRDYVLGATLMDGRGEILEFGGQVMKNVAGYDVSRLLAGAMGSMGLLLDVSLKVMPLPVAETTLVFALSEADALRKVNEWSAQPLPISASCWHVGRLMLRLSGAAAAIRAAREKLGGEEVHDAEGWWSSLREQSHDFFDIADGHGLWRLSLPQTAPALALNGKTLIEWGGAQRWLISNESPVAIRAVAQQYGGHATLFRGGDKSAGVLTPLSAPLERIHRQLKQSFDAAGIFNPGRMYSGW